jgi:hypothetical protein
MFYETTFFASALEHCGQIMLRQRRQIGVMLKPAVERPITCVSALYNARHASKKEKKNILVGSFPGISVIGNKIKSTKVDDLIWLLNSAKK